MGLPPQLTPSSYTWQDLTDRQRRLGAASLNLSDKDQLYIAREVSAYMYTREMWAFTMATTTPGQIPCVNGVQDYPQPTDCRSISRAWFRVPTQTSGTNFGTVPPYDDPALLALQTAQASANYVGAVSVGLYPAALVYPLSGSLAVVKRLPVNLVPQGYPSIREVCQQPNQNLIRLTAATAVNANQPYSLELEYQITRPPLTALSEPCWFPDDYLQMASAGLLYKMYQYNNDPRAGEAVYGQNGTVQYTGQYGTWMSAIQSAAAAEREGSVNTLTPDSSLGADYGTGWY